MKLVEFELDLEADIQGQSRDVNVVLVQIAGKKHLRIDDNTGSVMQLALQGLRVRMVAWTDSRLDVVFSEEDAHDLHSNQQLGFMCHRPSASSHWAFACRSAGIARSWLELLRRLGCVMSDFSAQNSITHVLGHGGSATVYAAETKKDPSGFKRQVAVKCASATAGRQQLQNEANVLIGLQHPNVIAAYGVYEFKLCGELSTGLVLERKAGGELAARLEVDVGVSEPAASHILSQIFSAVAYIHTKGVIHRDIKLSNILCSDAPGGEMHVVLSDFGLATHKSNEHEMGRRCGTPGYIAPEMIAGHAYDELVDCFSLGVLTYSMLNGSMPFEEQSMSTRLRSNARADICPNSIPGLSRSAKSLISALCAKDPDDRIRSSQLLLHPWVRRSTERGSEGEDLAAEARYMSSHTPASEIRSLPMPMRYPLSPPSSNLPTRTSRSSHGPFYQPWQVEKEKRDRDRDRDLWDNTDKMWAAPAEAYRRPVPPMYDSTVAAHTEAYRRPVPPMYAYESPGSPESPAARRARPQPMPPSPRKTHHGHLPPLGGGGYRD
jgi:serine/threonine protein kinase